MLLGQSDEGGVKVNASEVKEITTWYKKPREMSNLLGEGYGILVSCTPGSTKEAVAARSRKARADLFIQS